MNQTTTSNEQNTPRKREAGAVLILEKVKVTSLVREKCGERHYISGILNLSQVFWGKRKSALE